MKDHVSEEEWKVRTDLAAAYHLAVIYGWTDILPTHFSARVPGKKDQFLLIAYGLMFDEVTASNLVKVDQEGDILDDITGPGINQAGFVFHGCIPSVRPHAHCVLHTHTRAGIAVSAMREGLLPLSQHSTASWPSSPITTTKESRSTCNVPRMLHEEVAIHRDGIASDSFGTAKRPVHRRARKRIHRGPSLLASGR